MSRQKSLIFFGLLALSIPAALPLLMPGFYEPHDLHHLADIYQMFRAFVSGQLPPRWGPDFSFGYGYPLFNFYYLLPFYLGAFFYSLLGTLTLSFKLVFLTSIVLSVSGMYLFLREFVGKWAAAAGSILFLYTPYHALQIYVRGAMGEALAFSILPFTAWALIRVVKKPNPTRVAVAALITGLFLIAHNYLWFLAAPPLVVLLAIYVFSQKKKAKPIKALLLTSILSLGAVSYWLVPAIVEQKLIDRLTPFSLIDHFPFIKQLIFSPWGYGSSVWGPTDELSFQIGIVNLAVVLIFIPTLFIIRKRAKSKTLFLISLWALAGFLATVFMMNIRSLPIWELIPFYNFIQFPWRLLILTTFFTSIIAAVLVDTLSVNKKKFGAVAVIIASIFLTYSYFQPSKVVHKADQVYLDRFFGGKNYSEDYLLLPNWVEERPIQQPESKIEINEGEVVNMQELSPVNWRAQTKSDVPSKVTFNSRYFPGWLATVDGREVNLAPGTPFGQIEIEVPEGEHEVAFFWRETPLRKAMDVVTLASLIFVAGLLIGGKRK